MKKLSKMLLGLSLIPMSMFVSQGVNASTPQGTLNINWNDMISSGLLRGMLINSPNVSINFYLSNAAEKEEESITFEAPNLEAELPVASEVSGVCELPAASEVSGVCELPAASEISGVCESPSSTEVSAISCESSGFYDISSSPVVRKKKAARVRDYSRNVRDEQACSNRRGERSKAKKSTIELERERRSKASPSTRPQAL